MSAGTIILVAAIVVDVVLIIAFRAWRLLPLAMTGGDLKPPGPRPPRRLVAVALFVVLALLIAGLIARLYWSQD